MNEPITLAGDIKIFQPHAVIAIAKHGVSTAIHFPGATVICQDTFENVLKAFEQPEPEPAPAVPATVAPAPSPAIAGEGVAQSETAQS